MKLTARDRRFVDEYLIDLDAERAALEAGYSKTVARTKSYCWVSNSKQNKKPHVFEAVQEAFKNRAKRTEITQDRVLQEFSKISFFDPRKLYNDEGNLLPVHKLDADVAAAIGGVDVVCRKIGDIEIEITKKVKFIDKKGALDSLAKHLGMFDGKGKLPDAPADITINYTDA